MENLKDWILSAAEGEQIVAVVIGKDCRSDWKIPTGRPQAIRGTLLTWEQAAPMLDYAFFDGFGSTDCDPIYAWTATKVIGISEYDGSTNIAVIPRHPISCTPSYL